MVYDDVISSTIPSSTTTTTQFLICWSYSVRTEIFSPQPPALIALVFDYSINYARSRSDYGAHQGLSLPDCGIPEA
jgi:hypothetical protein|tara:strand:- start:285 stop:512 length:228 start_codon:yes stop_codon:yes gene_type:complete